MAAPGCVDHAWGMSVSVLIVDDDPSFIRVATELLRDRGYSVLGHANSAEEGVSSLRSSCSHRPTGGLSLTISS
jgi:ActR/RegA family two-component response regulator